MLLKMKEKQKKLFLTELMIVKNLRQTAKSKVSLEDFFGSVAAEGETEQRLT